MERSFQLTTIPKAEQYKSDCFRSLVMLLGCIKLLVLILIVLMVYVYEDWPPQIGTWPTTLETRNIAMVSRVLKIFDIEHATEIFRENWCQILRTASTHLPRSCLGQSAWNYAQLAWRHITKSFSILMVRWLWIFRRAQKEAQSRTRGKKESKKESLSGASRRQWKQLWRFVWQQYKQWRIQSRSVRCFDWRTHWSIYPTSKQSGFTLPTQKTPQSCWSKESW